MEKEILDKYLKAGKIAKGVLEYGKNLVKKDTLVLDIVEAIERKIIQLEAKPAFPVNISINEIAAHYTPMINDKTIVKEEDYVKIDVGVHIDGFIGDTASTIRLAGKDELIECSEKMLSKALTLFKPGTLIGEIGEAIENVTKEFGFNSVRNLTGHSLSQYDLHAGVTIPNIKTLSTYKIKEDEVYAVEPFCTQGAGLVKDSEPILIFRWISDKAVRTAEARKILDLAKREYQLLPFAKRWIQKQISPIKTELILKQLLGMNALYGYNVLKEVSQKPVAQAEHTVIVKEKPIITTL